MSQAVRGIPPNDFALKVRGKLAIQGLSKSERWEDVMTSLAGRRTALQTFALGFGTILAGGVRAAEPSAAASLMGAGSPRLT
jgi:hypothetical protein